LASICRNDVMGHRQRFQSKTEVVCFHRRQ
jgi:hypothetical protein